LNDCDNFSSKGQYKMEVYMKKEKNFVKKLLAGFCAASLLFGALSCSSGSDDDDGTVDGGGTGGSGSQAETQLRQVLLVIV